MKRLVLALVALVFLIAMFFQFGWYVIVEDETGLAVVEARLSNSNEKQVLTKLPFGYFFGIPRLEGQFEVICSDGSTLRGGYVTPHYRFTRTVIGDGTCAKLV